MSVRQLSLYLKGVFDDEELLHDVTLTGEVAEVSYSDKHTFAVLADGDVSIRCIHFSSRDAIEKGARVVLRGSVRFYDKRTGVTFCYTEFFVDGKGDKNAKFIALKNKLMGMGYFENRPRLPRYIADVIVITSPDGAAIRDFMRVVYDKCPFVGIRVYPVKVQGSEAARSIVRAINDLQRARTDAIVLCRGGGSDEDLDCFNDEQLATAVATSRIPVISAIGHEVDYTLCDFCSGTRAGTPSIAGEIVNGRALRLASDIQNGSNAVRNGMAALYTKRVKRVARFGSTVTKAVSAKADNAFYGIGSIMRRGLYATRAKFYTLTGRLQATARRLMSAAARRFDGKHAATEKLCALLKALDPNRIIENGYAAVVKDGKSIKSVSELSDGSEITLVFADGSASAVITKLNKRLK